MIESELNSWSYLLGNEFQKPYFQLLKNNLNTYFTSQYLNVFPAQDEVYNDLHLIKITQLKGVINLILRREYI